MNLLETLGNAALFAFIAADIGAIYQAFAAVLDRRNWPPPGRLIDVGNHRLHIDVQGAGAPTVIFEAGGGSWSIEWQRVQPEVARFARTVTYDRSGYGWSDIGLKNPTGHQVAEELHTLLKKADISGPYVLVGRSLGGLYVRAFAGLYPEEVAGMVLVDAAHEDESARIIPQLREIGARSLRLLSVLRLVAPLGLLRFAGWWGLLPRLGILAQLPEARQQEALTGIYRSLYCSTLYSEYRHFEETALQVRAAGDLGDRPLVVLTAGRHLAARDYPKGFPLAAAQQTWYALQAELVALSRSGEQVILPECGNYIPLENPEAVIEAIRRVCERVRGRVGR